MIIGVGNGQLCGCMGIESELSEPGHILCSDGCPALTFQQPIRAVASPAIFLHGTLPQEFFNQAIDEFGDAYRDPDHDKRSGHRLGRVQVAFHAHALISKNWTGCSRVHLFWEVKIRGDEEGSFAMPPDSLMPYIEKLRPSCSSNSIGYSSLQIP